MITNINTHKSAFLILMVIMIISLYALSRTEDSERHSERTGLLLQLKDMEVRLDHDVTLTTSFLIQQYDPLVETRR